MVKKGTGSTLLKGLLDGKTGTAKLIMAKMVGQANTMLRLVPADNPKFLYSRGA
jgi:cell division protein FtsI/penicillin-binding protein 2